MGKELFDASPAAREVFEEADSVLGIKLSEMCFAGNEADLQLTANTQPAILAASLAAFRAMQEAGCKVPDFAAGHSLGEYSALVAAGVIEFADAVRIVRKRGTYMQEAVPIGVGAMAAILGSDLETVETSCEEAAGDEVCGPANINSASQIVIAGNAAAVDRACNILKAKGAKRAIRLNVSAPFHCSLMMPAQERLANDLDDIQYREFRFPVVHNVDAESNTDAAKVAELLTKQVSLPVRWLQSIEKLTAEGVETFVEVGPGKVLSGLVRQINRDARVLNVEDAASLRKALETL